MTQKDNDKAIKRILAVRTAEGKLAAQKQFLKEISKILKK